VRRRGRHESIRVGQVQVQSAGRVVMQVDVPMCFGEVWHSFAPHLFINPSARAGRRCTL
jgi:hypothetical protein